MDGKATKYYFYKERGSGSVTIPVSMAEGLNWRHKDELTLIFDVKEGNKGLFIFKKED